MYSHINYLYQTNHVLYPTCYRTPYFTLHFSISSRSDGRWASAPRRPAAGFAGEGGEE